MQTSFVLHMADCEYSGPGAARRRHSGAILMQFLAMCSLCGCTCLPSIVDSRHRLPGAAAPGPPPLLSEEWCVLVFGARWRPFRPTASQRRRGPARPWRTSSARPGRPLDSSGPPRRAIDVRPWAQSCSHWWLGHKYRAKPVRPSRPGRDGRTGFAL